MSVEMYCLTQEVDRDDSQTCNRENWENMFQSLMVTISHLPFKVNSWMQSRHVDLRNSEARPKSVGPTVGRLYFLGYAIT